MHARQSSSRQSLSVSVRRTRSVCPSQSREPPGQQQAWECNWICDLRRFQMRRFLAMSALALTLTASPAALIAQTMPDTTSPTGSQNATSAPPTAGATAYTPGPSEMSQMDTWPAEQKAKYQAWPADYKEYFWTLDADQQKGWWALTDEQKSQVFAMAPDERAKIWPTIVGQVTGQSMASANPMPASPTATPPASASMDSAPASSGAMATPPATAMNKTYPLCSKTVTDSCRNRGGV